jgi:hypothetical protein
MVIPLDGVWPKSGVFRPARHAWLDLSGQDLGGLMKTGVLIVLPIGLFLGLNHVAGLFDQLIIAGVLATGIVYCFFT